MAIDPKTTAELLGALLTENAKRLDALEKRSDPTLAIEAIGTGVAELRGRVEKLEKQGATPASAPKLSVAYRIVPSGAMKVGHAVSLGFDPALPDLALAQWSIQPGAVMPRPGPSASWTPAKAGVFTVTAAILLGTESRQATAQLTIAPPDIPPPPPPAPPPPPPPVVATPIPEIPIPAGAVTALRLPSASGAAPDTHTTMIGQPFRPGDIPAGKWPEFRLADGTVIPYSMHGRTNHDDGSLRMAGFILRPPVGISAGRYIDVGVFAAGDPPAYGNMDLTSIADLDLTIFAVGAHNIEGTWAARVNDAIEVEALTNCGGVATTYKVTSEFKKDGTAHASLIAWFYLSILRGVDGVVKGVLVLPAYSMPWLQATGDDLYKAFHSVSLFAKSETVVAARVPLPAGDVEMSVETDWRGPRFADKGGKLNWGAALLITGGEVLPEGAEVGKVYGNGNGGFVLSPFGPGVGCSTYSWSSSLKPVVGQKFTARVLPFIGRGVVSFLCPTDGEYTFISMNGGEVSRVAPIHNARYLRSTRIIPALPLGDGKPRAAIAPVDYAWGDTKQAGITPHEPQTGGRGTLGPVHRLHAEHFAAPTPVNWRNAMVLGLQAGWRDTMRLDKTTRRNHQVRNGTYPEMGQISMVGKRWYGGSPLPAGVDPLFNMSSPDFAMQGGKLCTIDGQHTNCLLPYSYIVSGRPEFADMLAPTAIERIARQAPTATNFIYRGRYYGGVSCLNGAAREDAWWLRDLAMAVALLPDTHHAKRHLTDCWKDTVAFMVAPEKVYPLFDEIGWPKFYNMIDDTNQFWEPRAADGMFAALYLFNMIIWLSELFPSPELDATVKQVAKVPRHYWETKRLPTLIAYYSKSWPLEGISKVPDHPAAVGQLYFVDATWTMDDRITIKNVATTAGTEPSLQNARYLRGFSDGDVIVVQNWVNRVTYASAPPPTVEFHKPYRLVATTNDSFMLETLDGAPVNWPEAGSGTLILTGIFAKGVVQKHFSDWPTNVQVNSMLLMLRRVLGPDAIPDAMLAELREWNTAAGIGKPTFDAEAQFVVAEEGWG